jgi:hypothetical protein
MPGILGTKEMRLAPYQNWHCYYYAKLVKGTELSISKGGGKEAKIHSP